MEVKLEKGSVQIQGPLCIKMSSGQDTVIIKYAYPTSRLIIFPYTKEEKWIVQRTQEVVGGEINVIAAEIPMWEDIAQGIAVRKKPDSD
jgi:hypothetical protein